MLLKLIDTINHVVDVILDNCMFGISKVSFGYITIVSIGYCSGILI